jgi:anti-sigma factor RsiW
MNCHDAGTLIDAYLDGEAAPDEAAAVREHLAICTMCARRLEKRESLRRLMRSVPYRSAPARLPARIAGARARSASAQLAWAAGVLLAIGIAALAYRQYERAPSVVATALVDRHTAALMRGEAFDVRSSNQHTVKPWFQGKIEFSPPVVDLGGAGFPLLGGRVDTVQARRVAVIVFGRREHIIDLFIWPDDGTADDVRTVRGFQERHWRDRGMSLWAISDLNDVELAEFVRAFQAAGNK